MTAYALSIGTRASESVDITGSSGAGPYTVTLAGATENTRNSDVLMDEHATPRAFLITAGAGTATLTVVDVFSVGGAPDFSGTSTAVTRRAYSSVSAAETGLSIFTGHDITHYGCNDSVLTAGATYNDTAPSSTVLTAYPSDRHDGTEGTGFRITVTGATVPGVVAGANNVTVSWLNLSMIGSGTYSPGAGIASLNTYTGISIKNNIIKGDAASRATGIPYGINAQADDTITNNIVYGHRNPTLSTGYGIYLHYGIHTCYNNTCYDNRNGIFETTSTNAATVVKNCISMGSITADFTYKAGTTATYNMSSDATADDNGGAGNIISKTAANQFVSTTNDFHLKEGSDAIGAGTNAGAGYTDINGYVRYSITTLFKTDIGAHQFYIESSVGTAQDFTTLTAWEAALSSTSGSKNSKSMARPLNQAFDESFTVNDSIPKSIWIQPLLANRHDGAEGTGARIVRTGAGGVAVAITSSQKFVMDYFDIDINDQAGNTVFSSTGGQANAEIWVRYCILHNLINVAGGSAYGINASGRDILVIGNLIYGIGIISNTGSTCYGMKLDSDMSWGGCIGNVIWGITTADSATGDVIGLNIDSDTANTNVFNNICAGVSSVAGTASCFNFSATALGAYGNNMSSDATANAGSGNITGVSASDIFVNAATNDFRLKVDCAAVGAGSNRGTTNGRNVTIDGTTRDSFTIPRYDMGAFIGPKTITKTIGTAQDYADLPAWYADFSTATIYYTGDAVVANMKAQTYTAKVTLIGGTIPFSSVLVKPQTGQEFNGTYGSGPLFSANLNRFFQVGSFASSTVIEIRGIEVQGTGSTANQLIYATGTWSSCKIVNPVVHTISTSVEAIGIWCRGNYITVENPLVFDINSTGANNSYGIAINEGGSSYIGTIINGTVDNITSGSGSAYCYGFNDHVYQTVKGCIGTSAGTRAFQQATVSSATVEKNLSDDSSASGTGSLANTNPLYIDVIANNYRVVPTSPSVEAGGNYLATDILGVTRMTVDTIGCYYVAYTPSVVTVYFDQFFRLL